METSEEEYIQPIIANIDTTLVGVKNKLRRLRHINPYNKKIDTRMNKYKEDTLKNLENICKEKTITEDNSDKLKEYYKILREIKEFTNPVQTIDEQLCDLRLNRESLGITGLDWDINCNETFINQFTLIIAPSKSGKSYLINQLIYEIPHSFDKIVFFMGKASYLNICPQTLKHVCKLAGVRTQWINTDNDEQPAWSTSIEDCFENLNEDDSSNYLYDDTTNPSVYIFDDLYTKNNKHWVVNFMDTMACMSRHRKTSCFIAFQGFSRLSNKIVDNATKIFLYNEIIPREDLWRKLKIMPPSNINDVIDYIKKGLNTRWYYLDDDRLEEFIPFDITTKQQAVNKMKSKLPKSVIDEQKKKQVEELRKKQKSLENELNIKPENDHEEDKKDRRILLTDIKDAVKIDNKTYNQTLGNEHKFIHKGKRNGLRSKYGL